MNQTTGFLLLFFALIIALVVFLVAKRNSISESTRRKIINFAIVCLCISTISILVLAWISNDWKQLFKLSAPASIFIIIMAGQKRKKRKALDLIREH